jgi:hypothetical protein
MTFLKSKEVELKIAEHVMSLILPLIVPAISAKKQRGKV